MPSNLTKVDYSMQTMTHRLSDVAHRISESEERIEEQLQRIRTGSFEEMADAAMQLYCAVSSVQALRAYQARLKELRTKPH